MANITDTFAYRPVPEWGKVMDLGDYPKDYFINFGAIICDIFGLILPNFILDPFIKFIAPNVSPQESSAKWLTDNYLPEIMAATKHNNIPLMVRIGILSKLVGVLIKIVYAFAF